METGTFFSATVEAKLVSSHSLDCQLSFDTLLNMFIVCIAGVIVR